MALKAAASESGRPLVPDVVGISTKAVVVFGGFSTDGPTVNSQIIEIASLNSEYNTRGQKTHTKMTRLKEWNENKEDPEE